MMIPLSRPPVEVPDLRDPRRPGFGLELDQIKSPLASGGGGGGAAPGPFDLTFEPSVTPGELVVTMIPGQINGVIPSDYLSLPDILDVGEYYLVLSVTAVDGQIATASIDLVGSPPAGIPVTLGVPPTAFDLLIGVVIDGVWFRSTAVGNKVATPLETFRAGIINPPPGTLPYEIYYSWSVP